MLNKDWVYRRGDIYYVDLNPVIGSEQGGSRPVVVIQNNSGNRHAPTLIVAMITSKTSKNGQLPTHYLLKENPALDEPSVVLLEQLRTIDKRRVREYLGRTSKREMLAIDKALVKSLSLNYLLRLNFSDEEI
ncbi:type II toxin-antitoxin system PemK/MazF family toxin [Thomasclavelia spiroformis]|uniref:type II toxin-antitoxin system PemK/MazF family toxin n=1 Tax=Thomasclavelia spiroformis TaxID=29348 RepID=UPI0021487B10|nr:type II toxin-antitoxin system PemK/MazF family toxin [Thomasclavelia spiroformis]MCR0185160.1 type II toxin-antitoxin system PemK/MazF family toxin [[Clostridium] innocuum]